MLRSIFPNRVKTIQKDANTRVYVFTTDDSEEGKKFDQAVKK